MSRPGRRPGAQAAALAERLERRAACCTAEAAMVEIKLAERAVEQVRRGRGDLNAAIARLRRARLVLADVRYVIERH